VLWHKLEDEMAIIFLFLIISCFSFSQTNDTKETQIQVACGVAGMTSPEILTIKKLHLSKDYAVIREKLIIGNTIEKLVSAIILQEYVVSKKIILSQNENEKIKGLKKSKQRYFLCYTCTVQLKGTYAELLKPTKSGETPVFSAYELIKRRVFENN